MSETVASASSAQAHIVDMASFTDDSPAALEGHITVDPAIKNEEHIQNTLDEPVLTTIRRDLMAVVRKFFYVLIPHQNNKLLHDCKGLEAGGGWWRLEVNAGMWEWGMCA